MLGWYAVAADALNGLGAEEIEGGGTGDGGGGGGGGSSGGGSVTSQLYIRATVSHGASLWKGRR